MIILNPLTQSNLSGSQGQTPKPQTKKLENKKGISFAEVLKNELDKNR